MVLVLVLALALALAVVAQGLTLVAPASGGVEAGTGPLGNMVHFMKIVKRHLFA